MQEFVTINIAVLRSVLLFSHSYMQLQTLTLFLCILTLWRRNFLLNFSTPVFKM